MDAITEPQCFNGYDNRRGPSQLKIALEAALVIELRPAKLGLNLYKIKYLYILRAKLSDL